MLRYIDTHCHLDAAEFDGDRDAVIQAALEAQVAMVIPAVERSNFLAVRQLAAQYTHCYAALGIHPLFIEHAELADIDALESEIKQARPVAIGEIGLDFYVDGLDRQKQEQFFCAQLMLAKKYNLPVLLHVRGAIDTILKHLRRIRVVGGIAHAFNGSLQQGQEFIKLGFKLGFGGAMTYPRALRIRDCAIHLPLEFIVLETDAPDIPPEWLKKPARNSPDQLPQIAEILANLRQENVEKIIKKCTENSLAVLPDLCVCTHDLK